MCAQKNFFSLYSCHIDITSMPIILLIYLQFSVIEWAKQRLGQSPFEVKSDEAIQI
jgi:hypothetical protein